MNQKYITLYQKLDEALDNFLLKVDKKNLKAMATSSWTVKDVLGHITFWHEYYAQQYKALSENKMPYVHRSLAGKNEEGRKEMSKYPKYKMINKLKKANSTLKKCILEDEIPKMRYMKSREYKTDEFLDVVIGHINRHAISVRRAK